MWAAVLLLGPVYFVLPHFLVTASLQTMHYILIHSQLCFNKCIFSFESYIMLR